MKPLLRRTLALLMGCMLLPGSTGAFALGLSGMGSIYLNTDDMRFAVSAQLRELLPYGEQAIENLNAALKHVSVAADVTGNDATLEIHVAGDPVVSLRETATTGGTQLTTPLLPNRVLTSADSAMDALIGAEQEEAKFDLFAAIEELQGCYQQLTDAILPYAEEKAANYTIKNIAPSRWSRIARLTPEQSAELAPLIAQVLGCGMDKAYREQLAQATYGKGFIVGLYQTAQNGEDLAVYIKGDVILADGARRALSYQWAFTTKDSGERVDTFKYEMTRAKAPKDDRVISALYKRIDTEGQFKLDGESSVKMVDGEAGVTVTTTASHKLSGKADGDTRSFAGEMSTAVKTTQDGQTETVATTITPELSLIASEGGGVLTGTATVEQKTGKTTHFSAVLTFDKEPAFTSAMDSGTLFVVTEDMMPASSLTQNLEEEETVEPKKAQALQTPIGYVSHTAPESETTVDLDTLSEPDSAALMDELSQNLAGKLLIALSKLPAEDTALLRDNLSEEDYAAFEALVEGL